MVLLVQASPLPSPTDDATAVKDISDTKAVASPGHPADGAPFLILPIPGKGSGMVAQRRILPGEIILEEAPLLIVPDEIYEDIEKSESFIEKQIGLMTSEQREQFFSLTDCRTPEEPSYLGVFYTNDMNYEGDAAVCTVMARANHSCKPNAEFVSRKDLGVQRLIAMYLIEAGDEITISYMPVAEEGSDLKEVRQDYLREWYGFQCTCADCTLQGEELERNEELREEIKQLQSVGLKGLSPQELEELIDKLYLIHGKLSYILDIVDVLYKSILFSLTCHDVIAKFSYGVRGYLLAVVVHGEDSDWAELWRDRKLVDDFDTAQLLARWS